MDRVLKEDFFLLNLFSECDLRTEFWKKNFFLLAFI